MKQCDALPDGWVAEQGCGQCGPCLERAKAPIERGVVDLGAYRDRHLTSRQRYVLWRINTGADCGLCGDLGAVRETTGVGVPCIACQKVGIPAWRLTEEGGEFYDENFVAFFNKVVAFNG